MKYIQLGGHRKKSPIRGYAIVDDEDFEMLNEYKWRIIDSGWTIYARTNKLRMHRLIINCPEGKDVDHIDGNGLNNQRVNLRICNHKENLRNKGMSTRKINKDIIYKGVRRSHGSKTFEVLIGVDGKQIYGGAFKTQEEAAQRYNELAITHHGEFARLNLIQNSTGQRTYKSGLR